MGPTLTRTDERYLLDTNVLSLYFSGQLQTHSHLWLTEIINTTPNISIITSIELQSWIPVPADKNLEARVRAFVQDANVLPLTEDIVTRCVKIRRGKKIRTPDAIIAAHAIVGNFTLIAKDNGFERIPDLKFYNINDSKW